MAGDEPAGKTFRLLFAIPIILDCVCRLVDFGKYQKHDIHLYIHINFLPE
uniref:Uncharacterized protein n=1 Tax=Arundo donax TaxID=35708 RepID=A0A0A9GEQ7_ARUDO